MGANSSNITRSLDELVSLDLWHDKLNAAGDLVDLHADVVFKQARMGGGENSNVRFRLELKRAVLLIKLPADGSIGLLKASVARDEEPLTATVRNSLVKEKRRDAKLGIGLSNLGAALGITGSANASYEQSFSENESASVEKVLPLILSTGSRTREGHYQWELRPYNDATLIGRPWVAEDKPRMKLVDCRQGRGIPDPVSAEIHCLREDLHISDIHVESDEGWLTALTHPNKIIAAEAYIRHRLAEEKLQLGGISDAFSRLIIADAIATD